MEFPSPLEVETELFLRKKDHWKVNPVDFVKDNFGVTPEPWQADALNGHADPTLDRVTMKSAVGCGKSATLAWMGWHTLSCFGNDEYPPKGAALSITGDNLRDNLWSELALWQQRSLYLQHHFTWTASRIFKNSNPENWFISARSYPQTADADTLGRTLSGLHADTVIFLIDESALIPIMVGKAALQAVGEVKARRGFVTIAQAGNPLSTQGLLYDFVRAGKGKILSITGDPDNPKRSQRMDVDWAREMIKQYGEDDPWVMSQIFGEFPETGINTLLGIGDIEKSQGKRVVTEDISFAEKRIGVDVARFGLDSTVIQCRQGLMAFNPIVMRGANGHQVGTRVLTVMNKFKADKILIDDTGGYGSSVVDFLQSQNVPCIAVNFGGKSDTTRYFNKRSEMWFLMSNWVKRGGKLPKSSTLTKELLAATYTFKKAKMALEEKEIIRKRVGHSTDYADALALTFAIPDQPKPDIFEKVAESRQAEYNPFSRLK